MQAKQMDENPYYMENRRSQSLSGLNTLEKVEVWRSKGEGSAITNASNGTHKPGTNGIKPNPPPRNSVINQDDDNYKIWTGIAPTEREMLYVDATGTMRSLKSATGTLRSAQAKIRQMAGGIPRPPPPPSPSLFNGKEHKNNKSSKPSKTKSKKKQKEQQILMNGGSSRMMNGMRPVSVMGHYGSMPPPPPQLPYRNSGYYTERRIHKNGRLPLPGHEEPIYISSSRPLSPVSTYQPAAFPYEQYFMQYGTAPRNMQFRDGISRGGGRHSHQALQQQHYYQPQTFHAPAPPEKPSFIVDASEIGNDDAEDPDDDPFNTGIYKKKGHLNERAFSYSIRQEHRSRSNSLASLRFYSNNDSLNDGDGPERSRDEDRKERELAQLVNGLDLKDNGMPGTTSSRRGESNFIKKKSAAY